MLGFVLAAVSPAVVVPCLLALQARGLGVDKGEKEKIENNSPNQ